MGTERRFYWLKLKEDFFESKRIKKLRKIAGGDTLTIIYLKMQLKSIKTDGVLTYTGLERSFAEELALDLDEDAENVGLLLNYLISVGLIETSDDQNNFLLPYVIENTGSEGTSAERVRNFRERQKALQSNADVTQMKRIGNVEKEIDIEIEKEREIDSKRKRFQAPTVDEVNAYCIERNNGVNAERFVDYYSSQGWKKANGRPLADWKAAVRQWEQRDKKEEPKQEKSIDELAKEWGWDD